MADKRAYPIGVFDSGLGGLTVVRELSRQMPSEDILYYGDTARVPYGTKSRKSIVEFSRQNAKVLIKRKVKMIVVACNSSSSYALAALKKEFSVPIVGVISAGARKAAEQTKNNKVGVIATSATIASNRYVTMVKKFNRKAKVYTKPTPLFVPLVEEGWSNKAIAANVAREYLSSLKKTGIDTLILGCTHYPLLKKTLSKVMGPKVVLIDSAKEIASEVKRLLTETDLTCKRKRKARHHYLISDRPQAFKEIARGFLGYDIKSIEKV